MNSAGIGQMTDGTNLKRGNLTSQMAPDIPVLPWTRRSRSLTDPGSSQALATLSTAVQATAPRRLRNETGRADYLGADPKR